MTPAELRKKTVRLAAIADSVSRELSEDPGISPAEHHFYALAMQNAKAGLEQGGQALRMAAIAAIACRITWRSRPANDKAGTALAALPRPQPRRR